VKRWTAIDRTLYQVSWNGVRWRLEATPGGKYPWVMYNGNGVRLAVGQPEIAAAQARVSFGLRSTISTKEGVEMGSKHTGDDDSQTDHVGKGSDGHTTESGKDK
jgi:hypothetical protein